MLETVQPSIWPILLPVLIGGLLTFFGGLSGPIVGHLMTSNEQKRVRREEQFERLLSLVEDYDNWLDEKVNITAFGDEREPGPSPFPKAMSVALMHFPELVKDLRAVEIAAAPLRVWLNDAGITRIKTKTITNAGFGEAYQPYAKAKWDFQEAAFKYVKERAGKI